MATPAARLSRRRRRIARHDAWVASTRARHTPPDGDVDDLFLRLLSRRRTALRLHKVQRHRERRERRDPHRRGMPGPGWMHRPHSLYRRRHRRW